MIVDASSTASVSKLLNRCKIVFSELNCEYVTVCSYWEIITKKCHNYKLLVSVNLSESSTNSVIASRRRTNSVWDNTLQFKRSERNVNYSIKLTMSLLYKVKLSLATTSLLTPPHHNDHIIAYWF